jgi:hypothetical protein
MKRGRKKAERKRKEGEDEGKQEKRKRERRSFSFERVGRRGVNTKTGSHSRANQQSQKGGKDGWVVEA